MDEPQRLVNDFFIGETAELNSSKFLENVYVYTRKGSLNLLRWSPVYRVRYSLQLKVLRRVDKLIAILSECRLAD